MFKRITALVPSAFIRRLLTAAFLVLSVMVSLSAASPYIEIRVSVKVILENPTNNRPPGITDAVINDAADAARQWQNTYARGYHYTVTEILDIGGSGAGGGATGPSKWYGVNPAADYTTWTDFQNDINTDPLYMRRTDQVNVYITLGISGNPGGACPSYIVEPDFLSCTAFINDGPWWMNHELGHFFGLSHTFDYENAATCTPGDDGIADTLPDSTCWNSLDDAAVGTYGVVYALLNAAQQQLIDDVYFNVMSYHEWATKDIVENRMTELQLDRMADVANTARNAFVTGKTWFAKPGGTNDGDGSSTDEYQLISNAVAAADVAGGDIIMLRPGTYQQAVTITKPVTLRSTRMGTAVIGP